MKTNLGLVAFAVLVVVVFLALGAGVLGGFAGGQLWGSRPRPVMVAPTVVVTPDLEVPASRQAACEGPSECAG